MPESPSFLLVRHMAQLARDANARALMVGGCVRDRILGVEPKDIDVELFGLGEKEIEALLHQSAPHVIRVGRAFPVWKIWNDEIGTAGAIDVAAPRREVKTGGRHTDFEFSIDPELTFTEAAARRDFTMNAIAEEPLTGFLLDPHGGRDDLKRGILRHVSPRFAEDPLRVLRGMQFCARFDLTAAPETLAVCRALTPDGLSKERIFGEFEKLLLKSKRPSQGLRFLADSGWDRYFPEIAAIKGVPQDPIFHPEGDAWVHTGHCLDAFARRRTGDRDLDLRRGFAVLTHDFGKATHTQFIDGRWRAFGHEEAGGPPTRSFLLGMTNQLSFIGEVEALVVDHMAPTFLHKEAKNRNDPACMDAALRRLSARLAAKGTNLGDLAVVCACDKAGRPPLPEHSKAVDWLLQRAESLSIKEGRPAPLLLGRDLIGMGLTPGPLFKELLQTVYKAQIEGAISSREEALLLVGENLRATRSNELRPLDAPRESQQAVPSLE